MIIRKQSSFYILIFFLILFFGAKAGHISGENINISISVSNLTPSIGENVDITFTLNAAPSQVLCVFTLDDGQGIWGDYCDDINGCSWTYTTSYNANGPKLVTAVCSMISDYDTNSKTINVGGPPSPSCVPDGCNQHCPPHCSLIQDPDCGCRDNDGCCGIACDYNNDNDCPAPLPNATSYRNPIVSENIPQFVQQIVRYFFQVVLYGLSPLFIIIGAYVMVVSGGSSIKIQRGKRIVIWTLAGVAVILIARGLIALVIMLLGG